MAERSSMKKAVLERMGLRGSKQIEIT